MVKIRLMRMGAKKRPFFRLVVADSRSPRDGRFIENIGKYHPLSHPSVIEIDEERALHWLRSGAQPTDPARVLLQKTGVWSQFTGEPAPPPLETVEGPSAPESASAAATEEPEGSAEAAPPAEQESEGSPTEPDQPEEETPGTREEGEETP
jgi:small subunit ribosomal protein S16